MIIFPKMIANLPFYQIPVLIYHSIGGHGPDAIPLGLFKLQMSFLKLSGFRVISLHRLISIIKANQRISVPLIALTFDDGYADTLDTAYPILKEHQFPATLFIWLNRLGQNNYLNFAQLKQIARDSLINIGSHTINHSDLSYLDERKALYELIESKRILEENLGCSIDLLAYPYGQFSPSLQCLARQAGYKAAFTTNSRISNFFHRVDPFALRRMTISKEDSLLRFLIKVSGFGTCFARKIKCKKFR